MVCLLHVQLGVRCCCRERRCLVYACWPASQEQTQELTLRKDDSRSHDEATEACLHVCLHTLHRCLQPARCLGQEPARIRQFLRSANGTEGRLPQRTSCALERVVADARCACEAGMLHRMGTELCVAPRSALVSTPLPPNRNETPRAILAIQQVEV